MQLTDLSTLFVSINMQLFNSQMNKRRFSSKYDQNLLTTRKKTSNRINFVPTPLQK